MHQRRREVKEHCSEQKNKKQTMSKCTHSFAGTENVNFTISHSEIQLWKISDIFKLSSPVKDRQLISSCRSGVNFKRKPNPSLTCLASLALQNNVYCNDFWMTHKLFQFSTKGSFKKSEKYCKLVIRGLSIQSQMHLGL